jgi:hypothetical protein
MKKTTSILMATLLLGISMVQTSCMGSWGLTTKIYKWNEDATGSKFLNNLIFWVLLIIPIYSISIAVDFIILNLIEFWTGSNPLAMEEGQIEKQIVSKGGIDYEITATKNRFDVVQLTGDKKGAMQSIIFNPENKSASFVIEGKELKAISFDEKSGLVTAFRPDGSSFSFGANASLASIKALGATDMAMAK